MQIEEISVDLIKPDPDQPRSKVNESKVEEMALSLKNTKVGIINPIEVDEDNVIVTGETRWRAAKLAGLKTIPCKRIKPEDRFLRQVIENIHQGVMTDWDTAKALKKLLSSELVARRPFSDHPSDKHVRDLARMIGKSHSFISEKLSILAEKDKYRTAIKEGKLTARVVREAKRAPEEYQDRIKDKFIENEIPTRDAVIEIAQAVNRRPELADQILDYDYSDMSSPEVAAHVRSASPTLRQETTEALDCELNSGDNIVKAAVELQKALRDTPPHEVSQFNQANVFMALATTFNILKSYVERRADFLELEKPAK